MKKDCDDKDSYIKLPIQKDCEDKKQPKCDDTRKDDCQERHKRDDRCDDRPKKCDDKPRRKMDKCDDKPKKCDKGNDKVEQILKDLKHELENRDGHDLFEESRDRDSRSERSRGSRKDEDCKEDGLSVIKNYFSGAEGLKRSDAFIKFASMLTSQSDRYSDEDSFLQVMKNNVSSPGDSSLSQLSEKL